jgi:polyhydroxybutyrate depolymerase
MRCGSFRAVAAGWGLAAAIGACGGSATQADGDAGPDAGNHGYDASVPDADAAGTGDDAGSDATGAGDGSSGDAGMPVDSGPCATRSGHRGLTSRSTVVGGATRTYLIYLPPNLDPSTQAPFVFVHHGLTMSGQAMHDITQFTDLADKEGIGVAFPDGQSGPNSLGAPWNVGPMTCPATIAQTVSAPGDDFAFIDAMEVDVAQDQCLDKAHVFVTGFSMGGFFSHHAGCMDPEIRAVAPHSGGTHDLSNCITNHKPIIIFHGDSDPIIPDGCDDPNASNTPLGFTPSAEAWAKKNGCSTTVTTMPVQGGTCSYYQGCPADGQVALCVLKGMGHCWAGGAADGGLFSCSTYASATQLEWQFFKQYAW